MADEISQQGILRRLCAKYEIDGVAYGFPKFL